MSRSIRLVRRLQQWLVVLPVATLWALLIIAALSGGTVVLHVATLHVVEPFVDAIALGIITAATAAMFRRRKVMDAYIVIVLVVAVIVAAFLLHNLGR